MSFHETASTGTIGATMKYSCCVLGCNSNSETPGVLFYPFPMRNNKVLRQDWIESTGRMGWKPHATARMCSLHFKNYKKCKMPTLNLPNTSQKIFLDKPVPVMDETQTDSLPMETFTDGRMSQLKTNIARRILSESRQLVDMKMLRYLKRVLTQPALCKRPSDHRQDKKHQAAVEAALAAIESTPAKHVVFERWYRKKLRYLAAPFVMCAGVERRALAAAPSWLRRAEAQLRRLPDSLREHFPIEECETMVECVTYATMGREQMLADKYGVSVDKILDVWNTISSMLWLKLALVSCAADDPLQLQMCAHLSAREWRAAALVLLRPRARASELVLYSWSALGRPARELLRLVQQYALPAGGARAWYSAYKQYVQPGLACSMVMLQRRWYDLKLDTRETFFAAHRTRNTSGIHPLHWIVAIRYPHVLTQPMPSWQQLVADGEVVHLTPEQMKNTLTVAPEPLVEDDYQMFQQCVDYMNLDKNPKIIGDNSLEANTELNAVDTETNTDNKQNAAMDIDQDAIKVNELNVNTAPNFKMDTESNAVIGAEQNAKMDIESEIIMKKQNSATLPCAILSPPLPDTITDLKTTIETNTQLNSEHNLVDDVKTVENELKALEKESPHLQIIDNVENKIEQLFKRENILQASDSLQALENIDPSKVETTVVFENDSDSDDMQLYVDEDTADNVVEVNSDDDSDYNPNSLKLENTLRNIKKEISEDMSLKTEPYAGKVKSENAIEDSPAFNIPCLVNSIISEYDLNKSTELPDPSRNIPYVVDDKSNILVTNQNINSVISSKLSSVVKSEPADVRIKSKSRIMFEDDIDIDILNKINKMETSEDECNSNGNSEPHGDIDPKLTMDAVVKLVRLEHLPLWANVHNNTHKPVYKRSLKDQDLNIKEEVLVEKAAQQNLDDKSSCSSEYPRRRVVLPDLEQVRRQLSHTPAARVAPVSVTSAVQGTSEPRGKAVRGSNTKDDGTVDGHPQQELVEVVRPDTGDMEQSFMHRFDFVEEANGGVRIKALSAAEMSRKISKIKCKETTTTSKYAALQRFENKKDLDLNATLTTEEITALFELEKKRAPGGREGGGAVRRGARAYCCVAAWARQLNDARRRAAQRRRQPAADLDWHRERHNSDCECCCLQQTRGVPPDMASVQALRQAARATIKQIIRQAKHTAQKLADQNPPEPSKTTDTAKSSSEDELTICEVKKRRLKKPANENKTEVVPKKKKKKKKKNYDEEEPKEKEILNDYDEWIRQKNEFKRFFTIGSTNKEAKSKSNKKIKENIVKKDTENMNEANTVIITSEDTNTLPSSTVTNNTLPNKTLTNNVLPSNNTLPLPDNIKAINILPSNAETNIMLTNTPLVSDRITLPTNTVTKNILAKNTIPSDILPENIATDNTLNSSVINNNLQHKPLTSNLLASDTLTNNLQSSTTDNKLGNNKLETNTVPNKTLLNLLISPSVPPNISQNNPLFNAGNVIISTFDNKSSPPPQIIGNFIVSTGKRNELVIQPVTMVKPVPEIDLTQDDDDSPSVEKPNTKPAEARKVPDLVALNSIKKPNIMNLTQSKCLINQEAKNSASNMSEKNQDASVTQSQHRSQIKIDSQQGKVVFKIVNPHPPTLKMLNQIIKENTVKAAKGISVKTPTAINASLDEKNNYLLNANSEMSSANKESLKLLLNDSRSFLNSMLQESSLSNDIDLATPSTSTNTFAPLTVKNVALHDITEYDESNNDSYNTDKIKKENVSDGPVISNIISLNATVNTIFNNYDEDGKEDVKAELIKEVVDEEWKEESRHNSLMAVPKIRVSKPFKMSDNISRISERALRSVWRLNTAAKVCAAQFLRQAAPLRLLRAPRAAPLAALPGGRLVLTERLLRCEQPIYFGLMNDHIYRLFGLTPTTDKPVVGCVQLVAGNEASIMGEQEGGTELLTNMLAAELAVMAKEFDNLHAIVGKVLTGVTSIALAQKILSEGSSLLLYDPSSGHMCQVVARERILPPGPGVKELVIELNKLNGIVRSGEDWTLAPPP